jgi:FdhD protein
MALTRLKEEAVVRIVRCEEEVVIRRDDAVAAEEPLEIFVDGAPCYLAMRSPGRERELALGYCFSEGLIDSLRDVDVVKWCADESASRVDVTLNAARKAAKGLKFARRRLPAYSGCGICGKEMIEDICTRLVSRDSTLPVEGSDIRRMLRALELRQEVFGETGGTHAAALFNRDFELLGVAEDIGRHNALDKVIGGLVIGERLDDIGAVALTSRISYEMVQKVGRTRAELVIGMSSPTSLGVELAKKIGVTVVGFASQCHFNVYSGFERIVSPQRGCVAGSHKGSTIAASEVSE